MEGWGEKGGVTRLGVISRDLEESEAKFAFKIRVVVVVGGGGNL